MNLDRTQKERSKQTERIHNGFKLCKGCSITKVLSEFSVSKNKVSYRCKVCIRQIANKKYSEDRVRLRSLNRASEFKNNYGITLDEYDEILKLQKEKCAICNKHSSECPRNRLYVDHNHNTKLIRGLLCMNCNTGLGHMKDNIELLKLAIIYLEK